MRTFCILFALTFGCTENVIDKVEEDEGEPAGPVDGDDDGFTEDTDCDDSNPNVHPEAAEVCDDIDNDCDDEIDEEAVDMSTWFGDNDGDGYGNPDESAQVTACEMPEGYTDVSMATDCDDLDEWINPGADEFCDGVDNDCDDEVDEEAINMTTWYADSDEDGFGDPSESATIAACEMPDGYTDDTMATDCDDSDVTTYPLSLIHI